MGGVDGASVVAGLMCLALVASSLVARRLPLGQTAKMAAAWIGIFALGFLIFSFRGEFAQVGARLKSELLGTSEVVGEEVRIPMADDGHFWTEAQLNGQTVRFLVDSGASTTTIAGDVAQRLTIRPDGQQLPVSTANGVVAMDMARVSEFQLATIERTDMRVLINPGDNANVLGMNFLSSLSSWRVDGRHLILTP